MDWPYGPKEKKMSTNDQTAELRSLGSGHTDYPHGGPDAALLEAFTSPFWQVEEHVEEGEPVRNPNGVGGNIHIEVPEFTSLCPKTGQPDFATIVIDYTPRELCVESKSLKLYLGSFRNAGEFHENCTCRITNDLVDLMQPYRIQVQGRFTPRGGIPFWPTAVWAHPELQQQGPQGRVMVPPEKKIIGG